jgi:glycosyltransferase involved in cell wall biosynthesis
VNDIVALSLLTLIPGISGGTETYARQLCAALAREGDLKYAAYVPAIAPDAADGLPSEIVASYPSSRTMLGRIAGMARVALAPGGVRRAILGRDPAVIHFPLSVMLPRIDHPAVVATVHDIQHELFPQFFSRAEIAYRRLVYGWTIRKSARIITDSDHSRATLIQRYGLDPARVVRIHFAVDHDRFRPAAHPREPFLLYPANRWRHKNHETLFEALAILRRSNPELRLVLTGSGHDSLPRPEGVTVLGHVPAAALVALYQTAAAVVFPSLYEGFGLPVLEAMACGCPVACSNVASLPEISGDAAVLFDPRSAGEIAAGVLRVLEHGEEYAARGVVQASKFTWSSTARQHEDVYKSLMM